MSLLKADYRFEKITDITAADLKSAGAKLVLLDADNTLSLHGSQEPACGVPEWIEEIKPKDYKILLEWLNKAKDFNGVYVLGF